MYTHQMPFFLLDILLYRVHAPQLHCDYLLKTQAGTRICAGSSCVSVCVCECMCLCVRVALASGKSGWAMTEVQTPGRQWPSNCLPLLSLHHPIPPQERPLYLSVCLQSRSAAVEGEEKGVAGSRCNGQRCRRYCRQTILAAKQPDRKSKNKRRDFSRARMFAISRLLKLPARTEP